MGAFSVLLIAVGAILVFAVNTTAKGVNIHTIGVILMIVGGIGLLASMIRGSFFGFTRTRETAVTDDGRAVVEREHVSRF
jgi:hypothetical protein